MAAYLVFPNDNPSNSGSAYVLLIGPDDGNWYEDAIERLVSDAEDARTFLRIHCAKPFSQLTRTPSCRISHLEPQREMHQPFATEDLWLRNAADAAMRAGGVLFWFSGRGCMRSDDMRRSIDMFYRCILEKVRIPELRIAIGYDMSEPPDMLASALAVVDVAKIPLSLPRFADLPTMCEQAVVWSEMSQIL